MTNKTDILASKYLGKKVEGSENYNSEFLVAIPRKENREQYDIIEESLPFCGYDVWHAYEFSSMTNNGLPVTRVLKLKYSSDSEFLVESKSLKLYLNSFNMSRFGNSIEECLDKCLNIIKQDLSNLLKTQVELSFLDFKTEKKYIFSNFKNIVDCVDENEIFIDRFKEAPDLLNICSQGETKEYYFMFDSLRSNCRVTHQPDFGDVFIYYKSSKYFDKVSLIKYLSSFRSEYHFHEECCEMIFKRLTDLLDERDELFVAVLYTRRGGIDICPVRYTKNLSFDDLNLLSNVNIFARNTLKQ